MKVVWKYDVPIGPSLGINMPRGAEFLHVAEQHGRLQLWALVDPRAVPEVRAFTWLGTGHETTVPLVRYIGSVLVDEGRFVFHLFETLP